MNFVPRFYPPSCWRNKIRRYFFLLWLAILAVPATGLALPDRLVLALDGISYRDFMALQAGIGCTNFWGKPFRRQAFTYEQGYFPVSRMISTFPSASDVAWTDIFGDRPLPGYQRTYFSRAVNSQISINGITTTMEHERQMHWQVENGFLRALGYLFPVHMYKYELHGMAQHFLKSKADGGNFYVYVRSSDDAQHLNRNVFDLLGLLDKQLQDLRARYLAQEGHDLQIVILSDHGHNHAGRGQRFEVRTFLKRAGYRIAKTIKSQKDVVLPTVGIEDWVEIHNAPAETEKLAQLLCHLQGVDLLVAPVFGETNRFLVMNAQSERAIIQWQPAKNSFRYSTENGDPLNYLPLAAALARNGQLDAAGFATADDWMTVSMTNHYPLALERIVRSLTRSALNPATIIISLDNQYVNANWLVEKGSRLVSCGSTHGGLDDINSDGMLVSNFVPTKDTSTDRVAGQFDDFSGVCNFRAAENGAEWITKKEQALTRIARVPFDRDCHLLPGDGIFLRMWSPKFANLDRTLPVEVTFKKIPRNSNPQINRNNQNPAEVFQRQITLKLPVSFPDKTPGERVYALPPDLNLEPRAEYTISGWIQDQDQTIRLFAFPFYTSENGHPVAY